MKLQAKARLTAARLTATYTGKTIKDLTAYANELVPGVKFPASNKAPTIRSAGLFSTRLIEAFKAKLKTEGWKVHNLKHSLLYTTGDAAIEVSGSTILINQPISPRLQKQIS